MTVRDKTRHLTDREIAVILRDNNPLIHGRRDRALELVAQLTEAGATGQRMRDAEADLYAAEARVRSYEAYQDARIAEMPR